MAKINWRKYDPQGRPWTRATLEPVLERQTAAMSRPMLPGMGRPEFGGVQLRPGMESRRAYTGPQMGLFDQPATATQERMPEDAGILTKL